jgi:hypothetical protein
MIGSKGSQQSKFTFLDFEIQMIESQSQSAKHTMTLQYQGLFAPTHYGIVHNHRFCIFSWNQLGFIQDHTFEQGDMKHSGVFLKG